MDLVWIVQFLLGIGVALIGYMYQDVKAKAEKVKEDLADYKLHVAERYVSNDQLAKSLENLGKTIEGVASTVARIETRMNNQLDSRHST